MKLTQTIRDSEALIQWLDQRIDGAEIPSDRRSRLAAGCLDMALEHQKAILLLVAHKLYGSAFSLERLLFEAFVRGVWLHGCASEAELDQFERGKLDKTFASLVQETENLEAFDVGVLSQAKAASWKAMNSFTHTGFAQVVRRNTEATIEPNYEEAEVLEAVGFANAMGLLSACAVSLLADDHNLANLVFERALQFWEQEP